MPTEPIRKANIHPKMVERWAAIWLEKAIEGNTLHADKWLNTFLSKEPQLRRKVRVLLAKSINAE
jgi:hypothetical protein